MLDSLSPALTPALSRGRYGEINWRDVPASIRALVARINTLNNFNGGITSVNRRC